VAPGARSDPAGLCSPRRHSRPVQARTPVCCTPQPAVKALRCERWWLPSPWPGWRNGRRGGLKNLWGKPRASSSLAPGTCCKTTTYGVIGCCLWSPKVYRKCAVTVPLRGKNREHSRLFRLPDRDHDSLLLRCLMPPCQLLHAFRFPQANEPEFDWCLVAGRRGNDGVPPGCETPPDHTPPSNLARRDLSGEVREDRVSRPPLTAPPPWAPPQVSICGP